MKNVTISMDDELARETRIAAARAGKSVSRYIADRLRGVGTDTLANDERDRNLAALKRFLSGPKLPISENGRMPTAEERNARR